MVQIQSKLTPIRVTCQEYVHPWTDSCLEATSGLYLHSFVGSLRIYATVYVIALLMRGRIPTKKDIRQTLVGILQSTAFLSGTAFGYSLMLCTLRRVQGNFNILSTSSLPAFLSSVFSILIERPSRRVLLCLYVSNVATETLWNMALSRQMVRPIRHGQVALFSLSIATLLAFYKGGLHKAKAEDRSDSMFGVLRFVVGDYEEKDYSVRSSRANTFYRQHTNDPSDSGRSRSWSSSRPHTFYHVVMRALRAYRHMIQKIKCFDRHQTCPHPFSCVYYTIQGFAKMFTVGLGLQMTLKLILNMKKAFRSPQAMKQVLWRRDILQLGTFLGGFSGLFRGINCVLRRTTGRDSAYHAIPAGLLAGLAFRQYPDTTVALYVLWKTAQITYNLGVEKGLLPEVPHFAAFLYCLSTAVLFHAALLEPLNLRPSYWKFLHSLSGGRVACMNRNPLDVWGLNTSQSLLDVLRKTHTTAAVQCYLCS